MKKSYSSSFRQDIGHRTDEPPSVYWSLRDCGSNASSLLTRPDE